MQRPTKEAEAFKMKTVFRWKLPGGFEYKVFIDLNGEVSESYTFRAAVLTTKGIQFVKDCDKKMQIYNFLNGREDRTADLDSIQKAKRVLRAHKERRRQNSPEWRETNGIA